MIKNKNIEYVLFLATTFVLMASLFFQHIKGMQPCPLCLMQRLCVILILLLSVIVLRTRSESTLAKLRIARCFIAGAGLYFAGRQLWLMSLPSDKVPACMPGLDVLLAYFPWQTTAKALFWGAGDCADGVWEFIGISMPGWAALYFIMIFVGSVYLYKKN